MSDRKSSILPFFFVITFFSVSVITSFPVFVSVFVIAFFLCLRYSLFLFSSLSSLLPLFCFRHSATNYQVIQNAEVNNQKKTKNKVFAQRDKCYMGWFFILIFHLICNENGEMLNFYSGKLVDMPRK